jgi:hypothetical protein
VGRCRAEETRLTFLRAPVEKRFENILVEF